MLVIPVVDIMAGQVVSANLGARQDYKPLQSPLALSSCPYDVLRGFIAVYPFPLIYIADLDALQRQGNNADCIKALATQYPAITFWLDSGESNIIYADNVYPVLGTETGIAPSPFCINETAILSLDFDENGLIGDKRWLERTDCWPETVIIMMLDRVGSAKGPDWLLLQRIEKHAAASRLYAAGGFYDHADLARLSARGYGGVLISSMLHQRRIIARDVQAWSKYPD